MRQIPEEMVARIESGAATLCHVWLLTRLDGVTLGFTDHDRDLVVDGACCRAGSGWTGGASEARTGDVGGVSVAGGLDDDGITPDDIDAGIYDGAQVELWRIDWARPNLKLLLWRGGVARVRREGLGFIADIEGPLAALDRVVGRTFGRDCEAELGDARCGVDRSAYPGLTCDRRWTTCVERFNNGARFRGFPDIPGDDFLTAVPAVSGRNDGGSRR